MRIQGYDHVILCERYKERKECSGCEDLRMCIVAGLDKKGDDYYDYCRYELFEKGVDDISFEEWLQGGCVDSGVLMDPFKDMEFVKGMEEKFENDIVISSITREFDKSFNQLKTDIL